MTDNTAKYIFCGSYTDAQGHAGVRCFSVASDNSHLIPLCTADVYSPTYVLYHNNLLYAVGRTQDGCCVHTFAFDGHTLSRLGRTDGPAGASLCHLSVVDSTLYAAAYKSGQLLRFPLDAQGIPQTPQVISYTGSGPHPRQERAHVHSAFPSPDNRFLLICDLGSDRIYNDIILPDGSLAPNTMQQEQIAPAGSGPRHLTYSKDGTRVYVITELSAQVLVYRRDAKTGVLTQQQVVDCVPADRPDDTLSADIHLSSDEQFLYASSRGIDCIAIFRVQANGALDIPTYLPCCTSGPRHFSLSPDGQYTVISGQYSNNIAICPIHSATGLLAEPVCTAAMPQATCAQWVQL